MKLILQQQTVNEEKRIKLMQDKNASQETRARNLEEILNLLVMADKNKDGVVEKQMADFEEQHPDASKTVVQMFGKNKDSLFRQPTTPTYEVQTIAPARPEDEEIKTTVVFQNAPIGMGITKGVISRVKAGSQAERLGVKLGWKVISVNGDICSGDELGLVKRTMKTRVQDIRISFEHQTGQKPENSIFGSRFVTKGGGGRNSLHAGLQEFPDLHEDSKRLAATVKDSTGITGQTDEKRDNTTEEAKPETRKL